MLPNTCCIMAQRQDVTNTCAVHLQRGFLVCARCKGVYCPTFHHPKRIFDLLCHGYLCNTHGLRTEYSKLWIHLRAKMPWKRSIIVHTNWAIANDHKYTFITSVQVTCGLLSVTVFLVQRFQPSPHLCRGVIDYV